MLACVQRVSEATVSVDGDICGSIGLGLLVLLGVARDDSEEDAQWLAGKIAGLRVFSDEAGQMNCSIDQCGGEILVVSQFTLLGDCRKGRRPSFAGAAPPEMGEPLYERFVQLIAEHNIRVATGKFRAQMDVALINNGPVTLIVDSKDANKPRR
ncbi:MAG: D-aminoacyl-tRNA deacylase [Pirellulales bacterium]